MKKIFKYEVLIREIGLEIMMPKGAKILSFGEQMDDLYIWALVDPEETLVPRQFRLVATGQPVSFLDDVSGLKDLLIGSVINFRDAYVFHLFEIKLT